MFWNLFASIACLVTKTEKVKRWGEHLSPKIRTRWGCIAQGNQQVKLENNTFKSFNYNSNTVEEQTDGRQSLISRVVAQCFYFIFIISQIHSVYKSNGKRKKIGPYYLMLLECLLFFTAKLIWLTTNFTATAWFYIISAAKLHLVEIFSCVSLNLTVLSASDISWSSRTLGLLFAD